MDVPTFERVMEHKEHSLGISRYGDREDPDVVSIECEDCFESLFSRPSPEDPDPDPEDEAIDGAGYEELRKHADCGGLKVVLRVSQKGTFAEIRCSDCEDVLLSVQAEG